MQPPPLGIIEGYYGKPWSWADRADTIAFLVPHGYSFYIYAPKADEFLRERWREPHPDDHFAALKRVADQCRALGVRFGVGLSPFEIYRRFDAETKAALADKLAQLTSLGLDDLAILMDDMKGDICGLAGTQADIVHWIAERATGARLIFCPTYYSDDPILDSGYGQRPPDYLTELGAALDPAVEVFWTGEEVCARGFGVAHITRVAEELRRQPFLWDNYPVNDGPVMSQSLYVRAFTGRSAAIATLVAAHAVNPALQPVLTRIPALTLVDSYRDDEAYAYRAAFVRAAEAVMGAEPAALLARHVNALQDTGLDRLGERAGRLEQRWAAIDHPAAHEIIAFLRGEYRQERPA
ncbi:MAG TPA: beta-N-acetylglucosaminidase domain-containing protein [Caulobacteraceae bacterium]|nr:beta-N-acetylglucosaminidase domain-containing protein [Caulobacteraceae bacterium]